MVPQVLKEQRAEYLWKQLERAIPDIRQRSKACNHGGGGGGTWWVVTLVLLGIQVEIPTSTSGSFLSYPSFLVLFLFISCYMFITFWLLPVFSISLLLLVRGTYCCWVSLLLLVTVVSCWLLPLLRPTRWCTAGAPHWNAFDSSALLEPTSRWALQFLNVATLWLTNRNGRSREIFPKIRIANLEWTWRLNEIRKFKTNATELIFFHMHMRVYHPKHIGRKKEARIHCKCSLHLWNLPLWFLFGGQCLRLMNTTYLQILVSEYTNRKYLFWDVHWECNRSGQANTIAIVSYHFLPV